MLVVARTRAVPFLIASALWIAAVAPVAAATPDRAPQELAITFPDGKTRNLTRAQLLESGQVREIKVQKEPELGREALYRGIPLRELIAWLGLGDAAVGFSAQCLDGYLSYFTSSYLQAHEPWLILEIDGKALPAWSKTATTPELGPYYIADAAFKPAVKLLGYVEMQHNPYQVIGLHFFKNAAFETALAPTAKAAADHPEVQIGMKIAVASCLSCHNQGEIGGQLAARPWPVLAAQAHYNGDYFIRVLKNPQAVNPASKMPAFKEWDDATLQAVRAYFSACLGQP